MRLRGTSVSRPSIVEGFEAFGSELDRAAGVHVYDSTHAGYSTHAFTGVDAVNGSLTWQVLNRVRPVLTVVNLGVNDPVWGLRPAQTTRAVGQIVARAEEAAAGRPFSVLLVVNYTGFHTTRDYPARWRATRAALLAFRHDDVAVLDLQASWPVLSPGHPHGVMAEKLFPLHPNAAGHALQVEVISRALLGSWAVPRGAS